MVTVSLRPYHKGLTLGLPDSSGFSGFWNVMLALGRYDHVVPREPIDDFWSALSGNAAARVRKEYPTSHGFMGVRVAFAADIADFILAAAERE